MKARAEQLVLGTRVVVTKGEVQESKKVERENYLKGRIVRSLDTG